MKTTKLVSKAVFTLVAVAAFALTGCSNDPTSPGVQPEIVNGVDSFEFQVSSVKNYTGNWTYTWDNASTTASVDQSSVLSGGTAMLTISDFGGNVVYTRSMGTDGSFETAVGNAGDWLLTISLVGATGDLNFRVDEGS
jgi:uncharacterized lipoprotein NlpE involved in copper resistance